MSTSATEQAGNLAASETIQVAAKHAGSDPEHSGSYPASLSLDVRGDFPILSREFDGQAARVPRLGRDLAEAAGCDRRDGRLLPQAQRQRAPWRLRARPGVRRGLRRARAKVARFVGWDPKTTIFTKNVTEAINLVAYAWGRANVGPGDAVLTTQMEHHANIVPWQQLCKRTRRAIALPGGGRARRTLLGSARPRAGRRRREAGGLHARVQRARHDRAGRGDDRPHRAAGALSLVDGAQAVPHMPVDADATRRRLLRLDRPQGARPDRHRRAARPRGDPAADGALPDRRRHDRLGRLRRRHLERAALQVRGRHARRSPRRSDSAPPSTT